MILNLLDGIDIVLPADAEPLISQAWLEEDACYDLVLSVPYRLPGDRLGLAIVGLPREPDGSLREGEHYLIWDWLDSDLIETPLDEIRRVDASWLNTRLLPFLGRNPEGEWHIGVHYGRCGDEVPYFAVWLPVLEPGQFQLEHTRFQLEDPRNLWLQEDDRLHRYELVNGEVTHMWTLQDTPGALVHVREEDRTGNGELNLILVWEIYGEQWFDIYSPDGSGFQQLGMVKWNWQHYDLDADGVDEYLRPDNYDQPVYWDIYDYIGDHYEWAGRLERSKPLQVKVPDPLDLPPLGADLYLYQGSSWYRWPEGGGALEQVADAPDAAPGRVCDDGSLRGGIECISPDGRYEVVSLPHAVEGGSVGIRDRYTGSVEEIPGTFTYTVGHNEFSWDPNGQYLLHATADGAAWLRRILLPSGEVEVVFPLGSDRLVYGAVQPIALEDGSILFVIQSGDTYLYPVNGLYRYVPEEDRLTLLVELPPLYPPQTIQSSPYMLPRHDYGRLSLSPDSSSYFFIQGDTWSESTAYQAFFIADLEADMIWDLLPVWGILEHSWFIRWAPE